MEYHKATQNKDEINIKELFLIFWRRKFLILSISSIGILITIIYALLLPNIYTSSTLLAPSTQEDSLNTKLNALSPIVGLAGVNIPGQNATKSHEAIERIQSLEFFSKYFLPNIKVENLVALNKWVPSNNTLEYDKNIFDINTNSWLDDYGLPSDEAKPSDQEAFKIYKDILSITEAKKTSFVSISITNQSPILAKKWLDIIILNINECMREEDRKVAQNSINFLNESSKMTNIQSLKEAIAKLLESQLQTLMLTSSNDSYVYKIIDSPSIPEIKSGPARSVICIIGAMISGIISILTVAILNLRDLKKI